MPNWSSSVPNLISVNAAIIEDGNKLPYEVIKALRTVCVKVKVLSWHNSFPHHKSTLPPNFLFIDVISFASHPSPESETCLWPSFSLFSRGLAFNRIGWKEIKTQNVLNMYKQDGSRHRGENFFPPPCTQSCSVLQCWLFYVSISGMTIAGYFSLSGRMKEKCALCIALWKLKSLHLTF